ncbi:MAG: transposase [Psychromonas sp.]|nr:transposase [Psychromonas sp.]
MVEAKIILLEDRVYNKSQHRQMTQGILYRLRASCPWRDLPESFGLWNTIYCRFLLWSRKGILIRLFKSLSIDTDHQWEFIYPCDVKVQIQQGK